MNASAFPLQWPGQYPRTKTPGSCLFRVTLPAALKNVQKSLASFASDSGKKLEGLVISSNVTLGQQHPMDPGVAVWFTWDGISVCIAVDRYKKVEDNLQAIYHIIEARRVELRHGTLALVRATFTGLLALPSGKRAWWAVLGIPPESSMYEIRKAYHHLAAEAHPDKGGSAAAMAEVNAAYEEANREYKLK